MEQQIMNYRDHRVELELSNGTCLMGTIHWIQDDGRAFGISDGGQDACDTVATCFLVRIRRVH